MAKILVCFGENLAEQKKFEELSDAFEAQGFEVSLFDNILELELKPHGIFNLLEHVWAEDFDENEYYFLSNIEDFFSLCYRTMQHTFKKFIYWQDEFSTPYPLDLEDIYLELTDKEILKEENLYKKVFLNNDVDFANTYLNSKKANIEEFFSAEEEEQVQQTIYCLEGQCYMLEPSYGEVRYVYLDAEKVLDLRFSNFILPVDIDQKILSQAEDIFEMMGKSPDTIMAKIELLHKLFMLIRAGILTAEKKEQLYYSSLLMAMGAGYGIYAQIYSLSFLLQIYQTKFYYEKLLALCLETNQINAQNKYFVLTQAKHVKLVDREENALNQLVAEEKLYRHICESFTELCEDNLSKIDNFDDSKIVIFTSQFLNENHFETLLSLELSEKLTTNFDKTVYIINTVETLTQAGNLPFFDASGGAVYSEYSKGNNIEYKELKLPFIQMVSIMPSIGGIDGITEFLGEAKPGLIIDVSNLSVIAGIAGAKIPTVLLTHDDETAWVPVGKRVFTSKQRDSVNSYYQQKGLEVVLLEDDLNSENLQENIGKLIEKILG